MFGNADHSMKPDNREELNFRRFETIYPTYRDMGRRVREKFIHAQKLDLFNSKLIESQQQELDKANKENEALRELFELCGRLYPTFTKTEEYRVLQHPTEPEVNTTSLCPDDCTVHDHTPREGNVSEKETDLNLHNISFTYEDGKKVEYLDGKKVEPTNPKED